MGFELETDRVLIREWDPEDRRSLVEVAADPEVMRFVGKGDTWTPEKVDTFIARQIKNVRRYGYCLGALTYKSTGALIGLAGLQPLGTTDEVEVAWWLRPAYWGRGLATEAGSAILRFAFQQLGLDRIVGITHPENKASIRVITKLGMRLEREARSEELGLKHHGVDVLLYVIERSDFQKSPQP